MANMKPFGNSTPGASLFGANDQYFKPKHDDKKFPNEPQDQDAALKKNELQNLEQSQQQQGQDR